ncbi:hypothetical protein PRK78_005993 [Emydomyces testavorans]|uniref:Uncharacterized protein n=1 Tax=Emydomyces testavorans TaxID=2070801 RepID=A0AAF0IL94_9EURO|nr:hypothetical protein PRK78_005993 [Emydomyces testavorans]
MKSVLSKEIVTDSDDSSIESSASSESEKQVASKGKPQKSSSKSKSESKSKPAKSLSSSPNNQSITSSSDSESEVEQVSKSKKTSKKRVTIADEHSAQPVVPARPFRPPEGFQLMQNPPLPPLNLIDAFADLAGKQIWHITAPTAVPLASIKQLALDAVATGESVLRHKGVDYRLREDQIGVERTKSLLLPTDNGTGYLRRPEEVAQTFHVEQIVNPPTQGSKSHIEAMKKKTKALPSQPKNLRMRYMPFGSSTAQPEGDTSPDGSEMEVTFKAPRVVDIDGGEKKRKKEKRNYTNVDSSLRTQNGVNIESESRGDTSRKKSKKAHTHNDMHHEGELQSPDERTEKRNRPEKSEGQKSSKKRREETSQERRARRVEKKRKKQEKHHAI